MNDAKRSYVMGAGSALLCAMALGAAAWAGDSGSKFRMMDTNNDGMVSSAELDAAIAKMFGEMDAGHAGMMKEKGKTTSPDKSP
jgi:hypothetical protein